MALRPPAISPPALAIFLPREHGSWFLVLEPLALGLLVAPSSAGGALAVATLAAFFMRRPLKPAFSPIHSRRRRDAREVVVMWSALLVAGLFEVLVLGELAALWPLVPALLLGACFVTFDLAGEGREQAAEAAGSAAFAFLPAACALLAGKSLLTALALTALVLARSIPAVLVVRASLRERKGAAATRGPAWIASFLALGLLGSLAACHQVPPIAVGLGVLFLVRTAWLLGPRPPAWPARRVGQMEAAGGILYILLIAANWPSPI
jgi:hypothetical protein